jgi:hypothetical protein
MDTVPEKERKFGTNPLIRLHHGFSSVEPVQPKNGYNPPPPNQFFLKFSDGVPMTDLTEVLARIDAQLADEPFDDVSRAKYCADVRARLAALDAAGYQIVPKEPTDEMLYAAQHESEIVSLPPEENHEIWIAMLAAAPKP